MPSVGLLEQWKKELSSSIVDLKIDYLICGGKGNNIWRKDGVLKAWTTPGTAHNTIVISTMDPAASDEFINEVYEGDHLLIVADEVHRIGSRKRSRVLYIDAGERLGLSATPIRYGDVEGTNAIFSYFGGIVQPVYTLKNAIDDDVLTRYFYYPTEMHLSQTEQDDWNDLTRQINRLYARLMSGKSESFNCMGDTRMRSLMLRRARIVKNASEKVRLAGDIISKYYRPGQKWIVYCDNKTQLSDVLQVLINRKINAYEYHSEMQGDRAETLAYFSAFGGVLVSIRCLDEGIDIPSTTHALILASSKNPREFIQRRGRILRKSPGKNFAYLYDVVVTPNGELKDVTKTTSIIESELARAVQFGDWAENPSCIADLKNIAIDYGVDIASASKEGEE